MCLLTFLPSGVLPDMDLLRNGARLNDEGHGFAIVVGDRIMTRRGLDAEKVLAAFESQRRKHPRGPALFHSRLATHGDGSLANCHPFRVGGDPRTVLAHNGVLPAIVRPQRGDRRSDSRITAEDFLPAIGLPRLPEARDQIEQWMTPGNKIVILTVDPRLAQQAYILNEACGIWDGGIWYSNDGYQPRASQTGSPWGTPWRAHDEPSFPWCPICGAIVDPAAGECGRCGWCLDCGEAFDDCLCRVPTILRKDAAARRDRPPFGRW